MNEAAVVEQFAAAMAQHGISVDATEIVADGALHRIHASGDSKGSRNAWYLLVYDEHPAGAFGCNKRLGDEKIKWSYKGTVRISPEDRVKMRRERAAEKAKKEAERAQAVKDAAEWANMLWDAAKANNGSHAYLKRKGVNAHGLRSGKFEVRSNKTGEITAIGGALLLPLRDMTKKIWSLQAIFPDKKNMFGRDKTFLQGGRKQGLFYTIGRPVDDIILFCEGFATGASLHESTGHCAVVCVDAGNLRHVAAEMRKRFPTYIFVICCDNDRWTTDPVENPGVHFGTVAANEAGALLAVPEFASLDGEPTDYNDLDTREGAAVVAAQIAAVLSGGGPGPLGGDPEPAPPADEPAAQEPAGSPPSVSAPPAPPKEPPPDQPPPAGVNDTGGYFVMLGYDRDKYFFFQHEKRQVLTFGKGDFTESGLITLAPLGWWEMNYPAERGGIEKKAAMDWLVRGCNKAGIYDAGKRIRGRGAWRDHDRIVFHHGGYLTVDGKATNITDILSRYVYELSHSLPDAADARLSDAEGARLLEMASMFRWSKQGSAALLAGWVALAPLCGVLRWRPHIWITGGPGSGKSSALEKFVHPLMNGIEIYAQGSSTEAGIRQTLKSDAIPVLFEESESNEERDAMRVQNILSLIRQASSESHAKTLKGTAGGDALSFHIRSMFCLASIQVALKQQADIERMTKLALRSKNDNSAPDKWPELRDALYAMGRDETLAPRLFRRSLDLLPATLKNIEVFADVAAKRFGSQREGDQYGTLLAGAWSLYSQGLATHDDAEELISNYDWSEHVDWIDDDEATKAHAALMEALIKINGGAALSVYELIRIVKGGMVDGADNMTSGAADALLQRYGMRVLGDALLVSNKSEQLRLLMKNTVYAADLRGAFLRVPGASRADNQTFRIGGVATKVVALPLPTSEKSTPAQSGMFQPDIHGDQPF